MIKWQSSSFAPPPPQPPAAAPASTVDPLEPSFPLPLAPDSIVYGPDWPPKSYALNLIQRLDTEIERTEQTINSLLLAKAQADEKQQQQQLGQDGEQQQKEKEKQEAERKQKQQQQQQHPEEPLSLVETVWTENRKRADEAHYAVMASATRPDQTDYYLDGYNVFLFFSSFGLRLTVVVVVVVCCEGIACIRVWTRCCRRRILRRMLPRLHFALLSRLAASVD